MNFRAEPDDFFNFGYRENSLDDIPAQNFQSNTSNFGINNQNAQRRKSLINFSALGNESGNNNSIFNNQSNNMSNANDKSRLIPSRILSNMGAIQSETNEQPLQNYQKLSPPNNNNDLPPLSTVFRFSDQDSNHSQSPLSSPHSQTSQRPQNHFFGDEYSDKTSVTISDSSSGKAIQPTKQAKKGILKQQQKQLKQNQYQDEDSTEDQPDEQTVRQKQKPPPPELKMDLDQPFIKAIDNFKRYFFNEFKSILRPYSLPIASPEITNFTESLSDEISKSITLPPPTERNQAVITNTNNEIDLLIKEEASQIIESMKQKAIRMKFHEEKDINDLQKLDSEIKSLNSQYKKISAHVLKNLNHERSESVRINETDKLNQKMYLETKRKLSLKLLELESIKNRQNNEFLQYQRNENNLYSSREELHERLLGSYDMKYNKLRAKIVSEIDGLNEYIEDPVLETISSKADEIKSILRFGEQNKNQQQNTEQINPFFFMPQNYTHNIRNENDEKNSDEFADLREIDNIKSVAMRKLDELRKQREDAFKGIYPKKKGKSKT